MRGAVMYGPGDVRVEERDDPKIVEPTDAIVRLPATCICGSDLWPYRGVDDYDWPAPMGHEYAGKAGGIAVVIGSRIGSLAGPSEVMASQTVRDLTAGSGIDFEDAGEHDSRACRTAGASTGSWGA